MTTPLATILSPESLQSGVPGPLYVKLRQTLEEAITSGKLNYGDALPADPNARMLPGALEGSNVNPVECMVGMIAASRQFEQQMRLLQTAETDDKSAAKLLSLNG